MIGEGNCGEIGGIKIGSGNQSTSAFRSIGPIDIASPYLTGQLIISKNRIILLLL
jgi:hypothetical protein